MIIKLQRWLGSIYDKCDIIVFDRLFLFQLI